MNLRELKERIEYLQKSKLSTVEKGINRIELEGIKETVEAFSNCDLAYLRDDYDIYMEIKKLLGLK